MATSHLDLPSGAIEIINSYLYFVPRDPPERSPDRLSQFIFFANDPSFVYTAFFADFGPLDLGITHQFCKQLQEAVQNAKDHRKTVLFFAGSHEHKKANSAVCLCAYLISVLNYSVEQAYRPFIGMQPAFVPFRDAGFCINTFPITVLDAAKAFRKARNSGHYSHKTFSSLTYQNMAKLQNGDMSWIVPGKFIAFSGPQTKRRQVAPGVFTLIPEQYVPLFKALNVTCIVRFNEKLYDRRVFLNHGIRHVDLFYEDGGNPSDAILQAFLQICETEKGAIAVHCKAGLGRTGTNIAAFMIKHYNYTAKEAIAWCRVSRPGSIVGPQQQYLMSIESKLMSEGDEYREKHRITFPLPKNVSSSATTVASFSDDTGKGNSSMLIAVNTGGTNHLLDHSNSQEQQQSRVNSVPSSPLQSPLNARKKVVERSDSNEGVIVNEVSLLKAAVSKTSSVIPPPNTAANGNGHHHHHRMTEAKEGANDASSSNTTSDVHNPSLLLPKYSTFNDSPPLPQQQQGRQHQRQQERVRVVSSSHSRPLSGTIRTQQQSQQQQQSQGMAWNNPTNVDRPRTTSDSKSRLPTNQEAFDIPADNTRTHTATSNPSPAAGVAVSGRRALSANKARISTANNSTSTASNGTTSNSEMRSSILLRTSQDRLSLSKNIGILTGSNKKALGGNEEAIVEANYSPLRVRMRKSGSREAWTLSPDSPPNPSSSSSRRQLGNVGLNRQSLSPDDRAAATKSGGISNVNSFRQSLGGSSNNNSAMPPIGNGASRPRSAANNNVVSSNKLFNR